MIYTALGLAKLSLSFLSVAFTKLVAVPLETANGLEAIKSSIELVLSLITNSVICLEIDNGKG